MYKVLKRTCWAIVLPIGSFVFPCPRCRRRRGLLKVPNIWEARVRILSMYEFFPGFFCAVSLIATHLWGSCLMSLFFDTYSISCRRLMIEKIATHLADFSPRLQSNTRALYQVILHRALKWTACSLCRFFPSVTFLVLFCVLLHQWEILPHKTVLGCCI